MHPNEMTSRGISTEALLTSSGKHNGDVFVVQVFGHQEMEALSTSGIMLVAAFNNETNGISNFSGHSEMGAHGMTHHVSNLANNCGVHGFIVTVRRENAGFNCHARENGR